MALNKPFYMQVLGFPSENSRQVPGLQRLAASGNLASDDAWISNLPW